MHVFVLFFVIFSFFGRKIFPVILILDHLSFFIFINYVRTKFSITGLDRFSRQSMDLINVLNRYCHLTHQLHVGRCFLEILLPDHVIAGSFDESIALV